MRMSRRVLLYCLRPERVSQDNHVRSALSYVFVWVHIKFMPKRFLRVYERLCILEFSLFYDGTYMKFGQCVEQVKCNRTVQV